MIKVIHKTKIRPIFSFPTVSICGLRGYGNKSDTWNDVTCKPLPHPKECACHGTGKLVRDMTFAEVVELLIMILDGRACLGLNNGKYFIIIASSGGRVRIKTEG